MKRLLQILHSKKGLTLVELVTGLLTFTIISAAVAGFLLPTLSAYSQATELAELNSLLDTLSTELISEIGKASKLEVDEHEVITIHTALSRDKYGVNADGYLYRNEESNLLFPKDYYKSKTLQIAFLNADATQALRGSFTDKDKLSLQVSLSILDKDGGELVQRYYAVKPMGLNQYKTP